MTGILYRDDKAEGLKFVVEETSPTAWPRQWRVPGVQLRQRDVDIPLILEMVMKRQPWFERIFPHGLPPEQLPLIVERLRGTPARLEDRVAQLSTERLTRKLGDTWSIQENAGHFGDLEPLWLSRVEELWSGKPELGPADLTNRRTHEAHHNAAALPALLAKFRAARQALVRRLASFPPARLHSTALHPRLKVPMNVVDLAYFVAEHDDYHLARITELLNA